MKKLFQSQIMALLLLSAGCWLLGLAAGQGGASPAAGYVDREASTVEELEQALVPPPRSSSSILRIKLTGGDYQLRSTLQLSAGMAGIHLLGARNPDAPGQGAPTTTLRCPANADGGALVIGVPLVTIQDIKFTGCAGTAVRLTHDGSANGVAADFAVSGCAFLNNTATVSAFGGAFGPSLAFKT